MRFSGFENSVFLSLSSNSVFYGDKRIENNKPLISSDIYSIYKNGNSNIPQMRDASYKYVYPADTTGFHSNLTTYSKNLNDSQSSSDIEIIEPPEEKNKKDENSKQISIRRIVTTTSMNILN